MRGTRHHAAFGRRLHRFIPARAGNTISRWRGRLRPTVHPRTCGEHEEAPVQVRLDLGSSPHVRGTRVRVLVVAVALRFIPARAGNTLSGATRPTSTSVHPRTCGEHCGSRSNTLRNIGSSPHVRGTPRRAAASAVPRRFIPARAGNTDHAAAGPPGVPVHPRTCGEHSASPGSFPVAAGSSPHVRGTLFL